MAHGTQAVTFSLATKGGTKTRLLLLAFLSMRSSGCAKTAAFGGDSVFRNGAPDTIRTCNLCLRRATLSDRLK